jgi:beta-mannosidase
MHPSSFLLFVYFLLVISNRVSLLDGSDWIGQNINGTIKFNSEVPGNIYTDLMANGILGDPYYRFNVDAYRWVGNEAWLFSKYFNATVDASPSYLAFYGLDTVASVSLNGVAVGRANNMFRKYWFHIPAGLLKKLDNLLAVRFESSAAYAANQSKSYPYPVPWSPTVDETGFRNYIRREQATFGWDWGPTFLATGIWQSVELVAIDSVLIDECAVVVSKVLLKKFSILMNRAKILGKSKPLFILSPANFL